MPSRKPVPLMRNFLVPVVYTILSSPLTTDGGAMIFATGTGPSRTLAPFPIFTELRKSVVPSASS